MSQWANSSFIASKYLDFSTVIEEIQFLIAWSIVNRLKSVFLSRIFSSFTFANREFSYKSFTIFDSEII